MAFFSKVFDKFKEGLKKSREKISNSLKSVLTFGRRIDEQLLNELEEQLITDDLGVEATTRIIEDIRKAWKEKKIESAEHIVPFLKKDIASYWPQEDRSLKIQDNPPTVIMITGVNGCGKTTSVGKLAALLSGEGKKVVLAACDTFRAAAVEQLSIWADRSGVQIVKHKQGSDPAAVAYDACEAVLARGADILLIDTAGRLHTQDNLMRELTKIRNVIAKKIPGAPHEVILVLDATTGQNAINQAKMFDKAADLTGIILAKLDGTAKGGIVIAIKDQVNIPVKYIGLGEKVEDLAPFDPEVFVEALFTE